MSKVKLTNKYILQEGEEEAKLKIKKPEIVEEKTLKRPTPKGKEEPKVLYKKYCFVNTHSTHTHTIKYITKRFYNNDNILYKQHNLQTELTRTDDETRRKSSIQVMNRLSVLVKVTWKTRQL